MSSGDAVPPPSGPTSCRTVAFDSCRGSGRTPDPKSTNAIRRWPACGLYGASRAATTWRGVRVRACYPCLRITRSIPTTPSTRCSVVRPCGRTAASTRTTITQPEALFKDYLTGADRPPAAEPQGACRSGGIQCAHPVAFRLSRKALGGEGEHLEALKRPLRDIFDVPDPGDHGRRHRQRHLRSRRDNEPRHCWGRSRRRAWTIRCTACSTTPPPRRRIPELRAVHQLPVLHRRVPAPARTRACWPPASGEYERSDRARQPSSRGRGAASRSAVDAARAPAAADACLSPDARAIIRGITLVNIGGGTVQRQDDNRPHRRAAAPRLADAGALRGPAQQPAPGRLRAGAWLCARRPRAGRGPAALGAGAAAGRRYRCALEQAVEEVTELSRDGSSSASCAQAPWRPSTTATGNCANQTRAGPAFAQSRAIALDMESATIAANGFRFRVPYGTLLCVSDKPLHGETEAARHGQPPSTGSAGGPAPGNRHAGAGAPARDAAGAPAFAQAARLYGNRRSSECAVRLRGDGVRLSRTRLPGDGSCLSPPRAFKDGRRAPAPAARLHQDGVLTLKTAFFRTRDVAPRFAGFPAAAAYRGGGARPAAHHAGSSTTAIEPTSMPYQFRSDDAAQRHDRSRVRA